MRSPITLDVQFLERHPEFQLIELFPLDWGHVTDCGYTDDDPICECAALPGKIADWLAEHDRKVKAQALRDAADELEGDVAPLRLRDSDTSRAYANCTRIDVDYLRGTAVGIEAGRHD